MIRASTSAESKIYVCAAFRRALLVNISINNIRKSRICWNSYVYQTLPPVPAKEQQNGNESGGTIQAGNASGWLDDDDEETDNGNGGNGAGGNGDDSAGGDGGNGDDSGDGDNGDAGTENGGDDSGGSGDGDTDGGDESDESSDSGISVDPIKAAKEIGLGATVGEAGYPTPEVNIFDHNVSKVTLKESNSPLYLLGQLLVTIVPGIDIISDIKDAILNTAQGDIGEAILSVIGAIPVIGSFGDAAQVVKIANKWLDVFSSKADEALGLLQDTLFKVLPGQVSIRLAGAFTDAPLMKFAEVGVPPRQLVNYMDDIDRSQVTSLRKSGASLDNIWVLVKNDVDLGTAKRFQRQGIASVDDMAFYAKEGVHPRVIRRLRKGIMGRGALSQEETKKLIKGMTLAGHTQFGASAVVAYCGHQKQQKYPISVSRDACKVIS